MTEEERTDDELKIDGSRKSPNYGERGGVKPDMIVLHISEGYYDSGVQWLCNPKSQASTHFFVGKKGQVAQLVDIRKSAWGNATTFKSTTDGRYYKKSKNPLVKARPMSANRYTVSVEFEGFYKDGGKLTEAQHKKAVSLINHIRKEVKKAYGYEIPLDRTHIVKHCEVAPNWKPYCGKNIDIDRILIDAKAKIG